MLADVPPSPPTQQPHPQQQPPPQSPPPRSQPPPALQNPKPETPTAAAVATGLPFKPFGLAHDAVALSDDDAPEAQTPTLAQTEQAYVDGFEHHVGAMAQLDQYYTKANNYDVLEIEQKVLDDTIANTDGLAANYIDRVVAEQISMEEDGHGHDRSHKWGHTRLVKHKTEEEESLAHEVAATDKPRNGRGSILRPAEAGAAAANATAASIGRSRNKRTTAAAPVDVGDDSAASKRRRRRPVTSATPDSEIINTHNGAGGGAAGAAPGSNTSSAALKEQRTIQRQYDNTFLSIWKDLSRKDGPKVSRLMQQLTQAKLINLKKTAILAAREAKRWQLKNNKNQKDLTTKARRAMREMFNFWKRNERVEREMRRKHEKELLDKAKKEEEDREAKRQLRKLNFLITQTELYSHFIGKKIKTDEIEGADLDPAVDSFKPKRHNAHYDKYVGVEGHNAADFNLIDFDNEDEEALNKAAAANAQVALQAAQDKARSFDAAKQDADTNGDEMNFQNPTLMGDITVKQPQMLKCTLKEYQVKGLNWLANLYEQGINGILADEMGLGKTVQSISVLSYLAEHHNIWGPFLVVTPASTLHNWQQEISKFVPDFKVLPYWGNGKDRKVLRKFWDRKNVRYGKDLPFHVMVTSYQLVVADAAYFQKMKWQYMILDEAQAIKSSSSSRWKSLLSFQCRNRLLLTGTPIQNSMQELWALLHFIMPSLFDSHDEFSDWFSKDIESHAQSNTQLNEQQLRRLHMILKPFMLRRIKKNVQSELGDKVEIDLFCDLTQRQKKYYQMLKSQISVMDLLDGEVSVGSSGADGNDTSLMNLVMQFRKVCNHPDLFERADVKSPFVFGLFGDTASFMRETNDLECYYTLTNAVKFALPRLVFDELIEPSFDNNVGSRAKIFEQLLIYHPDNTLALEGFGWLRFVDTSAGELHALSRQNVLQRAIANRQYTDINIERGSRAHYLYDEDEYALPSKMLLVRESEQVNVSNSAHMKELHSVRSKVYEEMCLNVQKPAAEPRASAPPIEVMCLSQEFVHKWDDALFDQRIRASLLPLPLNEELGLLQAHVAVENFPKSNMLPPALNNQIDYSNIRMPSMTRFITESGKLAKLDSLLTELKQNDHRVLVYFQMTKMMDLMEEFLTFKQHKYIRLDGSSKLDDRRDLVHDWQSKPEIFVFLLSTRAGGLGINLTAADTVIFYDSDWNPTIDSQAMDRAHRLGQTRQVTVYRLLTRGTIEERMRNRAKQKEQVQQVVMEGKAMPPMNKDDSNKKKDVAFLLMGDDDDVGTEGDAGDTPSNKSLAVVKGLEDMYHEGEGKFSGTVTPQL